LQIIGDPHRTWHIAHGTSHAHRTCTADSSHQPCPIIPNAHAHAHAHAHVHAHHTACPCRSHQNHTQWPLNQNWSRLPNDPVLQGQQAEQTWDLGLGFRSRSAPAPQTPSIEGAKPGVSRFLKFHVRSPMRIDLVRGRIALHVCGTWGCSPPAHGTYDPAENCEAIQLYV
jgi:hypothetical protein